MKVAILAALLGIVVVGAAGVAEAPELDAKPKQGICPNPIRAVLGEVHGLQCIRIDMSDGTHYLLCNKPPQAHKH